MKHLQNNELLEIEGGLPIVPILFAGFAAGLTLGVAIGNAMECNP